MSEVDAVKVLECMAIDMIGALAGLSKKEPLADVLCQRIEAINLAQSALREKAEREKGCIFCSGERHCIREAFDEGTAKVISADNRYALSVGTSRDAAIFNIFFCPMCGKRLEVEHDGR